MLHTNKIITALILCYILSLVGCDNKNSKFDDMSMQANKNKALINIMALPPQYCPPIESFVKKDSTWFTKDNKWQSSSDSMATQITGYLGAQWIGIKVGQIICLYKTNEAVAFPVAMEQIIGEIVYTPQDGGWSALQGNRKICQSVNTVDCPFRTQPPPKQENIYEQIKYDPTQPFNAQPGY